MVPPQGEASTFQLLWKRSLDKARAKSVIDSLQSEIDSKGKEKEKEKESDSTTVEQKLQKPSENNHFRVPEASVLVYRVLAWKQCLTKDLKVNESKDYAADLEFLSKEYIEKAISNGKEAIDTYQCDSIEGLGFLSKTFRVTLQYVKKDEAKNKGSPQTLILKLPGTFEESFQAIADETNAYEREHLFYTKIIPIIDEIVMKSPPGKVSKMRVPKVYKSELVKNGARILMEDLGPIGYSVNQIDGLKPETVKCLVEMAANMHAIFWQGNPGASEIPDCVVKGDDPQSFLRRWNDGFVRRYPEFVQSRGMKVYDIGFDEEVVLKIGAKIHEKAKYILHHLIEVAPQTLIHADYRADNFMLLHKKEGEETGGACVLDWQLHCSGPATYDLVDAMIKSMTAEDGVRNCTRLLEAYHKALIAAGVKKYSWECLWDDFRLSILQHAMLVFDIGHDGIEADGTKLVANWSAFKLCHKMLQRLIHAIVEFDCLEVLEGREAV